MAYSLLWVMQDLYHQPYVAYMFPESNAGLGPRCHGRRTRAAWLSASTRRVWGLGFSVVVRILSSVEAQQPVGKAVWLSDGDPDAPTQKSLNFDLWLAYIDFSPSSVQDAKLQSNKAKEPLHLRPANGSADRDSCGFRGHQPLVRV